MSASDSPTHRPGWHDRAVANAADAWLNDPQDYEVYRRLVEAIRLRRDWLAPTLGFAAPNEMDAPSSAQPELTDSLGEDRPPVRLGDSIAEQEAMGLRPARDRDPE
jgi:hypothetical protein